MNINEIRKGLSINIDDLEKVTDPLNAAVLCVEKAMQEQVSYPETYVDLFLAGVVWNEQIKRSFQKQSSCSTSLDALYQGPTNHVSQI